MDRILLVDEDSTHRTRLAGGLQERGYQVGVGRTVAEGMDQWQRMSPDLVLTGDVLPDGEGLALVHARRSQSTEVVLMCSWFSSGLVFEAIARGAYDCLAKPLLEEDLARLLDRLEAQGRTRSSAVPYLAGDARRSDGDEEMVVGTSPGMLAALKTAGAVAQTGATVLIQGESGTGKELMARAIHRASGRKGPFVAVNCAAVAENLVESELFGHERGAFTGAVDRRPGCFEQADRGTLFLDEIGDAPLSFQAKLLRVLDRGEFLRVGGRLPIRVEVRIVAATNCDLDAHVESGNFRLDLFYRLSEVSLHLPPLRSRGPDLPDLVASMIGRIHQRHGRRVDGMSREALERLRAHEWPGNLRELQNVMHRAALTCRGRTISGADLDLPTPGGVSCDPIVPTLGQVEKNHISRVLEVTGGNRGRACELLGITRPTLRRKMRKYGLEAPGYRAVQP